MRWMPALPVLALLCCLPPFAKADDFQMVVIDPQTSFITPITSSTSLTFDFHSCDAGELPSGYTPSVTYVGCFTGQNDTGTTLTSLTLEIPKIPGQTAGCADYDTNSVDPFDIFKNITCGENPNGSYYLDFSGGSIASNPTFCRYLRPDGDDNGPDGDNDWDDLCTKGIFTIAEAGVAANSFPQVDATFNVVTPTPEPTPALLLSTGLLMSGLFYGNRRRVPAAQRQ